MGSKTRREVFPLLVKLFARRPTSPVENPPKVTRPVRAKKRLPRLFTLDTLTLTFPSREKNTQQRLLRPMPGVITQGVRPGHPALDIACRVGTPVKAAHDGQGRSRRSHTHGITFELRGPDGLETSYSHLHSAKPGGPYKRGQQIGECGNTGSWTTGPHLHFESNRPELLNHLDNE
ncbi:MAG: M23 family metallopeptidase [Candidatus Sericytochromatia bacterium]|nr:M23 family metallopeptidase [Candidatus Sericytochromatia bacterium]